MNIESSDTNDALQWEGDVFNRKPYSDFLTKIAASKSGPFVLNINSSWGTGKTFFIMHWCEDIRNQHPAMIFNAWESDYCENPLLAIISCINRELKRLIKKDSEEEKQLTKFIAKTDKLLKSVAPVIIKGITTKLLGEGGADDLSHIIKEDEKAISEFTSKATEEFIKQFDEAESTVEDFSNDLSKLLTNVINTNSELKKPFFIFVDELDRCRPTYAIETLERIKHLFSINDVVFVIATDTEQLSHSVKSLYGNEFDGRLYLKRFFDQEYALPEPNLIQFTVSLFADYSCENKLFFYSINASGKTPPSYHGSPPHKSCNEYTITCNEPANLELIVIFALFSKYFNLDLRSQKQCFDKLDAILLSVQTGEEVHTAFLIFLIMLQAKEQAKFNSYFSQNTGSVRAEIIDSLGDQDVNIRMSADLWTAKKIIQKYTQLLSSDQSKIRQRLNTSNNEKNVDLVISVLNNYENIYRYKIRVELAGALS